LKYVPAYHRDYFKGLTDIVTLSAAKHLGLTTHDIPAEILPPFGRQNDNVKWRCHAEQSEASWLNAFDLRPLLCECNQIF